MVISPAHRDLGLALGFRFALSRCAASVRRELDGFHGEAVLKVPLEGLPLLLQILATLRIAGVVIDMC